MNDYQKKYLPQPVLATFPHGSTLKPLIVGLALMFVDAGVPAWCETPSHDRAIADFAANPSKASTDPMRNSYADTLKPKVKRAASKQNELYTPIKKPDDSGQLPEIEMFVGESRVFPTPGVARIAVGNGQIMTAAALDEKEVIIFANGVGTSSLFVWNEDGRYQRVKVNIVPGDTTRIAREVAAFLTTIPNSKASIVGDKVIVEGDALSDEDRDKVAELAKRYPQIINFTSPIGWEKMVMMDVKVVEFPKTELRELGLKWTATGGAAIGGIWSPLRYGNKGPYQVNIPVNGSANLPITNPGSTAVTIPPALNLFGGMDLGIGAQLNLLEQNGTASVLAEPQLSARSGYKASFLAGGEFPYSVSTISGVTIIFKPYGIKLDIEPKIGRNGVIRAVIDTEVSSIDASITTAGGPALLTRKTKTEFNVKTGETIVLSGLLQRNTNTDIDKVPLLGDIPILGALFRSKRFQNKETELVIFVTPTIVDSQSPGLVDRVERATERLAQNLGKSPYLSDPLQPDGDAGKFNQPRPKMQPSADMTSGSSGSTGLVVADANSVVPVTQPASIKPAGSAILIPATQNPLQAPAAATQPVTLGGSTLRVRREGLVIHAEPDAKSTALLELGYGSVVLLGNADPQPAGTGKWRNVVVGEIDGWVMLDAVEPSHLQPQVKSRVSSAVATKERQGKMLTLGIANDVGQSVSPNSIQPFTAVKPAPSLSNDNQAAKRYRVNAILALRVSPDINALIVTMLAEGQMLEALPQPLRGNWMAVQVDGKRGWVAAQEVKPVLSQK